MSSLVSQARSRMPKLAEAAVARARLTVVPARSVRAPRAPFVTLVLLLLAGGVVGLLMLNTNMQQSSFYASDLEHRASGLQDEKQDLANNLQELGSPTKLAEQARHLGMVVPAQAAFLRLPDGSVSGVPLAATPEDKLRIAPWPSAKPADLIPAPIIVRVPATTQPGTTKPGTTQPGTTQKKAGASGHASTTPGDTTGRKKPARR